MRSYGKYAKNYAGVKQERKERTSTEWDVRIDTPISGVEVIVDSIKACTDILDYALVSGVERPDVSPQVSGTWVKNGAEEEHVHIALIFKDAKRRDQVLAVCRGLERKGGEYAVPRNRKFTYAGWYMHHTKTEWKIATEPSLHYEFGELPEDPLDAGTNAKVQAMLRKFGSGEIIHKMLNEDKFQRWLD